MIDCSASESLKGDSRSNSNSRRYHRALIEKTHKPSLLKMWSFVLKQSRTVEIPRKRETARRARVTQPERKIKRSLPELLSVT